ncbi:MAG: dihydropteroate synthase [Rhodothermales bacterium]|nr:dihydropteroate synthase [Rhodothermales bacterium]
MLPTHHPFILDARGKWLDCRRENPAGPVVMGILNVTPDSFSDGGRYTSLDAALARVETMISEGAAIIDVGGESTRPRGRAYGAGASAVAEAEERERVVPIIRAITGRFPDILVSIDTYKPAVARAALEVGAHLVNDVTGLRLFPETAAVAAEAGAPLIVMHSLGRPGEMPHEHPYTDVVAEVYASLDASIQTAQRAGVRDIVVDPGFGFGKTPAENAALIRHTDAFLALGRPVLVGVSRKSSIATFLGDPSRPPDARLFGSLGATAVAVLRGATLVRTHDIRETVDLLRVIAAVTTAAPR